MSWTHQDSWMWMHTYCMCFLNMFFGWLCVCPVTTWSLTWCISIYVLEAWCVMCFLLPLNVLTVIRSQIDLDIIYNLFLDLSASDYPRQIFIRSINRAYVCMVVALCLPDFNGMCGSWVQTNIVHRDAVQTLNPCQELEPCVHNTPCNIWIWCITLTYSRLSGRSVLYRLCQIIYRPFGKM